MATVTKAGIWHSNRDENRNGKSVVYSWRGPPTLRRQTGSQKGTRRQAIQHGHGPPVSSKWFIPTFNVTAPRIINTVHPHSRGEHIWH